MIEIQNYDLVETGDMNNPLNSCTLEINGISGIRKFDGSISICDFLQNIKGHYSVLLTMTNEWYGFMSLLTGDAGDENYEATLNKINSLSKDEFAKYISIFHYSAVDKFNYLCDITIDLKRLAEDMFKLVCDDYQKSIGV